MRRRRCNGGQPQRKCRLQPSLLRVALASGECTTLQIEGRPRAVLTSSNTETSDQRVKGVGGGVRRRGVAANWLLAFKPAWHAILWRVRIILGSLHAGQASGAGQNCQSQGAPGGAARAARRDHGFCREVRISGKQGWQALVPRLLLTGHAGNLTPARTWCSHSVYSLTTG